MGFNAGKMDLTAAIALHIRRHFGDKELQGLMLSK